MTGDQLRQLLDLFSAAGKHLPALLSVIVLIVVMMKPADNSDKLDQILGRMDKQDALIEKAALLAAQNSNRLDEVRNRNNCQIRTLDALMRKSEIAAPCSLDVAN